MQIITIRFFILSVVTIISACSSKLNVCVSFNDFEPLSVRYEMCGAPSELVLNSQGLWENENPIIICEGLGKIKFVVDEVTYISETPYVALHDVTDFLVVYKEAETVRVDLKASTGLKAPMSEFCKPQMFK